MELPGTNETVASPSPATAVTDVGGAGIPDGVAADEAEEFAEFPCAFVAVAVKVYAVPLVSPVISQLVEPTGTVHESPPGDAVTTYPVIGVPPLDAGAVKDTVAVSSPTVAIRDVGAPGTVAALTAIDAVDVSEMPIALVAVTTYL